MSWKYTMYSKIVTRIETNEKFSITYDNGIKKITDFELVPPAESKKTWSQAELLALKEELWLVMEKEFEQSRLRSKLLSLIQNPLVRDNNQAANIIFNISGKKVSARSIQAWLIEPNKRSSRNCPAWAVTALETYINNPENQKKLKDNPEIYKEMSSIPLNGSWEVIDKHSVSMAENEIESDERMREKWKQASLSDLPEMLFQQEKRQDKWLCALNDRIHEISSALEKSKDFDEFKRDFLRKLDEMSTISYCVSNTKRAIESGTDEFSNDEATL